MKKSLDGQYPSLNWLSYGIGYLEQFLAIASEPLLIAAAVIAFIDFQTHGGLLALPFVMYTWASVVGISVTACFIVTWRKALRAFSYNRYFVGGWLVILMLALGFADWAAVDVQSLQQTLGITFNDALARLGLNIVFITHIRAGVTIAMSAVVALSNHTVISNAQAPKRQLAVLVKVLDKIAPVVPSPETVSGTPDGTENETPVETEQGTPPETPDGTENETVSGTPDGTEQGTLPETEEEQQTDKIRAIHPRQNGTAKKGKKVQSTERRLRSLLAKNPDASVRLLAETLKVSATTIQRLKKRIEQQQTDPEMQAIGGQ